MVVSFLLLSLVGTEASAQGEKPKYTISQVMKVVHHPKKGILGRVANGTASKADKEKMLEMYESLAQNKPPAGDIKKWKERTGALVSAAKLVQKSDPGAVDALRAATNCKTCHDTFKKKDDD
jgi:cytochrome c556